MMEGGSWGLMGALSLVEPKPRRLRVKGWEQLLQLITSFNSCSLCLLSFSLEYGNGNLSIQVENLKYKELVEVTGHHKADGS